jgi:hypothetical protein
LTQAHKNGTLPEDDENIQLIVLFFAPGRQRAGERLANLFRKKKTHYWWHKTIQFGWPLECQCLKLEPGLWEVRSYHHLALPDTVYREGSMMVLRGFIKNPRRP